MKYILYIKYDFLMSMINKINKEFIIKYVVDKKMFLLIIKYNFK